MSSKIYNSTTGTTTNIPTTRAISEKHEYPSHYPPGSHWAITEAWRILDCLPVGILDMDKRCFIAGMIAGALMKERDLHDF